MSRLLRFIGLLVLVLVTAMPVFAQDADYTLRFQRDFGYGNGADVRGRMSVSINGDQATIKSVTFLMDGLTIAEVTAPPFKFSFETGSYALGRHKLSAVVTTTDGRTVTTPAIERNYVSSADESETMKKIIFPLLGGVLLLTLLGVGAQVLFLRGGSGNPTAPGTPRDYGMLGGAICPRCKRPFARHIWGLNMLAGKLDRCDNCGKWSIVRRASPGELVAAEQAELSAARAAENAPLGNGTAAAETDEERMRKLLDKSRYTEDK
jgi:hypothetical protein